MEDIVTLVDGAADLAAQVERAPESVRSYLRRSFRELLSDGRFFDALEGHLPAAAGPGRAARARAVLEGLQTKLP